MKKINHIITTENITLNFDGKSFVIPRDNKYSKDIVQALKDKAYDKIPKLVDRATEVSKYSKGNFVVVDGIVYVGEVAASEYVSKKILQFCDENMPYEPLLRFVERVNKNPSFRAVQELYKFLEKNNHPLTDDGKFIAYKKVRNDFKDIHSGTFDNSVGCQPTMPRNQVNEDPNVTCSYGLHVSNWDYAKNHFGSPENPMLEVEVDPADVVSIPIDYAGSKMRVSSYKVLAVVDQENSATLRSTAQSNQSASHSEPDYDESYYDDHDNSEEDY